MKSLTISLLLLGILATQPVSAHLCAPKQGPQITLLPTRPTVRPLTRYLTAMLHLSPKQAAEVQQTLRTHPLKHRAPEELTLTISPLLSLDAQQRLLTLQQDATTYQALAYLVTRH